MVYTNQSNNTRSCQSFASCWDLLSESTNSETYTEAQTRTNTVAASALNSNKPKTLNLPTYVIIPGEGRKYISYECILL